MIRLNAEAERTKSYATAADLYSEGSGRRAAPSGRRQRTASLPEHERFFSAQAGAWTFAISNWRDFRCCFRSSSGFRLALSRVEAVLFAMLFSCFAGVVQTIPSLALRALLVPLPFFGISLRTAIAALFLYSLLPIVRSTATGLQDIPRALRESAVALGLSPGARLWKIYLPMASRSILSGIKTSAVINIGTATLAALIGAGGLGEPIISGLSLNDHVTILEGAIPAAVLALLVQWCFDLLDRVLIPKGLRI